MITLAQVKEYCGIATTDYDTAIARYIPITENAVKLITRNRYNMQVSIELTSGSKYAHLSSVQQSGRYYYFHGCSHCWEIEYPQEYIEDGSQIIGDGIPTGAYISTVYDNTHGGITGPVIELSSAATASGSVEAVVGISIALLPVIAKGVMWKVSQENTSAIDAGWTSKSMGPLSISKGDAQSKIDNASGFPLWFVTAFSRYHGGH